MMQPEEKAKITVKSVDDVCVAYIRFLGQHAEIPAYFARLREQVEPYVIGDPICLYDRTADENPKEAHNLEVCYPVSQPVERGQVRSKILPGAVVACATRVCPIGTPWEPAQWWRDLGAFMRGNFLTIDEDPPREIRHRENEREIVEIQYTLQFPRWLAGLAEGLAEHAGEQARQQVMTGSAALRADSPIEERVAWVQGALERLNAVVGEDATRRRILNHCAHRFPQPRIEKLRAEYARLKNVDALLELMRADQSVGGGSWYGSPVREGNVIYNINDPASPEEYQRAQTETEKRVARCFCPIVRFAIQNGKALSPSFCNCSAGYTRQLYEGIFQQPVRVEILESVLQGDERCRYAIHLPPGIAQ